jgi:hypothetical protein
MSMLTLYVYISVDITSPSFFFFFFYLNDKFLPFPPHPICKHKSDKKQKGFFFFFDLIIKDFKKKIWGKN